MVLSTQSNSRTNDVTRLQQALLARGFDPRGIDGVFGNDTRAAVIAFQSSQGISADGVVGADTSQRLFGSSDDAFFDGVSDSRSPPSGPPSPGRPSGPPSPGRPSATSVSRSNTRGPLVTQLKTLLHDAGYYNGAINDQMGAMGFEALRTAKRALKLGGPSEVAGPTTFAALRNASRRVRAGRGWGGSEGVADVAKSLAASMGIPITSMKRDLFDTLRVGSTPASDHYTGNTNAYAVDFGTSGAEGTELARRIADAYGIPRSNIGTFNATTINVDGHPFSLQLLWQVMGHYDHVHLGIHRA